MSVKSKMKSKKIRDNYRKVEKMLFKEEKEKFIKELNQNFRTILSYGDKGLIPAGEFIVKDIQQPELPNEYARKLDSLKFTNIILTKIDGEKTEIVLPMTTFLTKFCDLAQMNADKFSISTDFLSSIQGVMKNAESKVVSDETLKHLVDAKTMSLEECDADYLINGEPQALNYSICPINLSVYRERIREREKEEKNKDIDDYER